jgi:hypothetical protein
MAANEGKPAHSNVVGGSTAARRLGCPASLWYERQVPKAPPSEYAREGSALHYIVEQFLKLGPPEPGSEDFLPWEVPLDSGPFEVDAHLWRAKGAPVWEALTSLIDQHYDTGADVQLYSELRLPFPGIPGAFGTADVVLITTAGDRVEATVIDLKFGHRQVDAADNAQLAFYASAVLHWCERELAPGKRLTAPEVDLVAMPENFIGLIIQPDDSGIATVSRHVWSARELQEYQQRLKDAVLEGAVAGPDARAARGPWCQFAPCRSVCPVWRKAAAALVGQVPSMPQPSTPGGRYDAAALAAIADALPVADEIARVAETWVPEVKRAAAKAILTGQEVPGYAVTYSRMSPRTWADTDAAAWFLSQHFDEDDYAPRQLLSLTKAEKLCKSKNLTLPAELVTKPHPVGVRVVPADKAVKSLTPEDRAVLLANMEE